MTSGIILAAGSSQRFGGEVPKQFIDVFGKPLIQYTIDAFLEVPDIAEVILVLPADIYSIPSFSFGSKPYKITRGGNTRLESVINGIQEVCPGNDIIIIDGDRPGVTQEILKGFIDEIQGHPEYMAGIHYLPAYDSLVSPSLELIPREKVLICQTPSFAKYQVAKKIVETWQELHTPKNNIWELWIQYYGSDREHFLLHPGNPRLLKITTPEDLEIFKGIILNDRV